MTSTNQATGANLTGALTGRVRGALAARIAHSPCKAVTAEHMECMSLHTDTPPRQTTAAQDTELALWRAILSLALALGAIGLAGARTVRNAVRLGQQRDDATTQSRLARSILRDHVACIAAIGAVLVLQLLPA